MNKIKLTDYTILFYLEKERLPYTERLDIFKQFIIDGKEKGIAYLAGDFNEQHLLNFIDYAIAGFNFILEELKENSNSSNHFHSLLYLIWGFPKKKLTRKKTTEILSLLKEFIVMKGLKETEYEILLKISDQLGKFDEEFLDNTVKRCPLINHRLVLTTAIELINKNNILHQFEFIFSRAEDLSKNGSSWAVDHERTFSKYVFDNLDYTNYQYLLIKLSADNNLYFTRLLNVNEYFRDNSLKYIDRLYYKLAELANENNSAEVINFFIDYLNKINYDSYSRNTYGDPLIFFNSLAQEDLFYSLLTSDTILKRGYILNKLFDLENTNRSREIIELYQQNQIDAERLKIIYCQTCLNDSSTSLNLSQFMSTEFPNEFGVITPLSTIQNQRDAWKKNGIKSLSNREEYIEKIQKIVDYIKDNNPELINEHGILNFGYDYHRLLDEQFENSIIIDFINHKAHNNTIEAIPILLDDDESWFIYLGKQIKLYKFEELQEHLKPINYSLQAYVNLAIETIDYLAFRDKEFTLNDIEIQIAIWFKEEIIDLPFQTAIQLLCHDTIDKHTLDRVRMNDFLIDKYSLDTIKPHLITIIEDYSSEHNTIALAIRTCIEYEIKEVEEEIYEILYLSTSLRSICSEYLIKIGYDINRLMQYLIDNPFISDDWQVSVVEYLLKNEFNHSQLLEIIETQIEFDPNLEYLNYIPRTLCKYGLKLGSRKCMFIFFEYLKTRKYPDSNIQYSDFVTVEHLFADELFGLSLNTLEIYKSSIRDHGRSDICGLLDAIITNLASRGIEKYGRTLSHYNKLIQENKNNIPTIKSLEWWKIRLTKKFQETNSRYLTEGEVIDFIERTVLG